MMIDINLSHLVPFWDLPRWIDATFSFTVGYLDYMYPRPIEVIIKCFIFLFFLGTVLVIFSALPAVVVKFIIHKPALLEIVCIPMYLGFILVVPSFFVIFLTGACIG